MKKLLLISYLAMSFNLAKAQFLESISQDGEIGVLAGASHYFGDLNTESKFNRPGVVFGLFARKQFGNYIALRLQGSFVSLNYADRYTQIEPQRLRNLDFKNNLFELTLGGDFNFYRFLPGTKKYRFTPYVTLAAGVVTFDPYTYLADKKYFLRPLGTEGQGNAAYPDRKPYSNTSFCFPVGVGFKYNLTPKINLFFELTHRFTTTDYLDDVSLTYVGIDNFFPFPGGGASPAMLLQDRSYELTPFPIGLEGRQRGNSKRTDQYVTAVFGVSLNFTSYKCPSF